VSKFQSNEAILEAYQAGECIFGESKVQELCKKQAELPCDISWHFIGHLQTNKVKYLVPFVDLIHGVDSLKLLAEINKQAAKINRKINCLLQIHIAQEDTKFGFDEAELRAILANETLKEFRHVTICGLMGMATFTNDTDQIRREFCRLKNLFDQIKAGFFADDANFSELSMGMSDDYQIAINEESTLVRIGTTIFGGRIY
jgi:pyridoxal phosphate enzyme (YggS family)